MNFFKNLLAAVLGNLIAFGFLFVILLMGIAGLASISSVSSPDGKQSLDEGSVLQLRLDKTIYDRVPAVEQFNVGLGFEPEALGLDQILHSIRSAAEDENIEAISLETQFIQAGWSQTRSIRRALKAFKEHAENLFMPMGIFTPKKVTTSPVWRIAFF